MMVRPGNIQHRRNIGWFDETELRWKPAIEPELCCQANWLTELEVNCQFNRHIELKLADKSYCA